MFMERELLVERTRAGLVAAKKLGRVGGRKRQITESKIRSGKTLLISGVSPKEVARNLGVFYSDALPQGACIRTLLAGRFFRFVKLAPFDRTKGISLWTLHSQRFAACEPPRSTCPWRVRIRRPAGWSALCRSSSWIWKRTRG